MEKVLLSIVALSGLCAASSQAERQYHFVYDLKNWTEAQRFCREKYTDLATVDNTEGVEILKVMADFNIIANSEYQAWIGLYDNGDSWRWSLSDTSFYGHGETEFRRWRNGEPNNFYSPEYCTEMDAGGYWNDFNCKTQFKAVCSDVTGSNVTFVLIGRSMNWTEAQSYCRKHHTDLVSVTNITDVQEVQKLIRGEKVWIDLYRDPWRWSDGSDSSFRFWAEGRPNSDHLMKTCVAASFNNFGRWESWSCDLKRASVCYSVSPVSKKVMRAKVRLEKKKDSSLDLNDPAVMEDLLKQLKQKLKDQGLSEDIQLSWRTQPDGKVFHKEEKKTKKKNNTKKDEF